MTAIYKKIATVQGKVKGLEKTRENKFGKYKYFDEAEAIKILKPLLAEEKLAMVVSDSQDPNLFIIERNEKEYTLRYQKIMIIGDGTETLTFYYWAMGQDNDIAKAKGKAETYANKYLLSKFWMMPVVDNLDPDQEYKGSVSPQSSNTQQNQPSQSTIKPGFTQFKK
jgi:hypothetical protein